MDGVLNQLELSIMRRVISLESNRLNDHLWQCSDKLARTIFNVKQHLIAFFTSHRCLEVIFFKKKR